MRPLPFSIADGKRNNGARGSEDVVQSSTAIFIVYSIELMMTTADGAQYILYAIILGMEAMIYGEIKFTFTSHIV